MAPRRAAQAARWADEEIATIEIKALNEQFETPVV
jgi:hypothetical protein